MGLWGKNSATEKDIQTSETLCKKRDALQKKWPQVEADWNKIDADEVLPAAERLSVAGLTANLDRVIEARKNLQLAIWKRNGLKDDFGRAMGELNAEIEMLNADIIFSKLQEWQEELSGLRFQKIVEKVDEFTDMASANVTHQVKIRSNFDVIAAAKKGLLEAIPVLRDMRTEPLSAVRRFIQETEAKLSKLDLTILKEMNDFMPESRYLELIKQPDMIVRPAPGSVAERIYRTYKP